METSSRVDVLIVGAGPTGLTLAAALSKLGIRNRLIDKSHARSDKSKAIGVQAGTLEALEQFFGKSLSASLVNHGHAAHGGFLHINRDAPIQLNFNQIPSEYNFLLMLEQSETERILEETLQSFSGKVGRGLSFKGAVHTPEGSLCEIAADDGTSEFVLAKYLVGCDGAHSKVREWAKIPFEGGTYTGDFILGDVHVSWPWEHNHIRVFISDRGALACFPMKGEQKYRVFIVLREQSERNGSSGSEVTWEEFVNAAQYLCPDLIELSNPVWTTRFKVHHRIASQFRSGSVFLAGDAAHIHSPVGAQGMNTGIQDAVNLASKIKNVIQETASPSLLNDYERQRLPVARNILRSTHFAFQMGLLSVNPLMRFARYVLLPKILQVPKMQSFFAKTVSEISVARREIKIRKNEAHLMNLTPRKSSWPADI